MLKKTFVVFVSVFLIFVLLIIGVDFSTTKAVENSGSGTIVGGIMRENTTWTAANSPYIITETVQIPENVTLTIEPGVTVTCSSVRDMFLLNGRLNAKGTADNKIIFDGGGNARFFQSGTGKQFVDLEYCIIRNGESFGWTATPFNLRHSEVINVTGHTRLLMSGVMYIEYNTFINWGGIGGWVEANSVHIRHNLFKGSAGALIIPIWTPGFVVEYNSFIDMKNPVISIPSRDSYNLIAKNNYWGTTNTSVIDSLIYDGADDITINGFVVYLPILTEPHPDTPTLPITVSFKYSPIVLFANVEVNFDAAASFGRYSFIANYTWDFGDGNITTTLSPKVKHSYSMPGNYNVTLIITDEFGFKNSTSARITVLEDNASPITLDDYDGLWRNTNFTIKLTATDLESGISETYYRINDGPVKAVSTDGQPLITTEGANNKLEYWSRDNAGNEELPHKILTGIKLDKTAPTGSVTINSGDAYTNSTAVMLSLNATDLTSGIHQVRFSNDGIWDTELWEAYSQTKTWVLTSGDGVKTVYVQFRDYAGLISQSYSDTIVLDATPPTGSIVIAGGAAYTNQPSITLTLSATDAVSGVAQMRFSNDNSSWSAWELPSASKAWTLASGDGLKTVYYQIVDYAGNIATYSASIILQSPAPSPSPSPNAPSPSPSPSPAPSPSPSPSPAPSDTAPPAMPTESLTPTAAPTYEGIPLWFGGAIAAVILIMAASAIIVFRKRRK